VKAMMATTLAGYQQQDQSKKFDTSCSKTSPASSVSQPQAQAQQQQTQQRQQVLVGTNGPQSFSVAEESCSSNGSHVDTGRTGRRTSGSGSSLSWKRLESAQKLNLILPASQKTASLSTPNIVACEPARGEVRRFDTVEEASLRSNSGNNNNSTTTTNSQLLEATNGNQTPSAGTNGRRFIDSLAEQLASSANGHGPEVSLFTGLPSCSPASAERLAATTHINPFFWGLTASSSTQPPPADSEQGQQAAASENNHQMKRQQVAGSTEVQARQPFDQQQQADSNKQQHKQLCLADIQAANALSPMILSPLSILGLSPEQEAWLCLSLSPTQHPLAAAAVAANGQRNQAASGQYNPFLQQQQQQQQQQTSQPQARQRCEPEHQQQTSQAPNQSQDQNGTGNQSQNQNRNPHPNQDNRAYSAHQTLAQDLTNHQAASQNLTDSQSAYQQSMANEYVQQQQARQQQQQQQQQQHYQDYQHFQQQQQCFQQQISSSMATTSGATDLQAQGNLNHMVLQMGEQAAATTHYSGVNQQTPGVPVLYQAVQNYATGVQPSHQLHHHPLIPQPHHQQQQQQRSALILAETQRARPLLYAPAVQPTKPQVLLTTCPPMQPQLVAAHQNNNHNYHFSNGNPNPQNLQQCQSFILLNGPTTGTRQVPQSSATETRPTPTTSSISTTSTTARSNKTPLTSSRASITRNSLANDYQNEYLKHQQQSNCLPSSVQNKSISPNPRHTPQTLAKPDGQENRIASGGVICQTSELTTATGALSIVSPSPITPFDGAIESAPSDRSASTPSRQPHCKTTNSSTDTGDKVVTSRNTAPPVPRESKNKSTKRSVSLIGKQTSTKVNKLNLNQVEPNPNPNPHESTIQDENKRALYLLNGSLHLKGGNKKQDVDSSDRQTVINENGEIVVKKKSRGGRKKKLVTHEELIARKNRSKERNRVAAKRCRQKRKQMLDELRDKIDRLSELNQKLQKENLSLKSELQSIKQHHNDCGRL